MGVHLSLVDFNQTFSTHSGRLPIIINDVPAFSEVDIERLNRLIYTTFSSDLLNNIPSCDCGEVTGEYNIGVICPECKTPAQSVLDQDLQPLTWIRAPHGVKKLVNLIVWTMLGNHFKVGNFNFILWLCDTAYQGANNNQLSASILQTLASIEALGIQRGFNNFVDNFDDIISKLFTIKQFRPRKGVKNSLHQVLIENREKIFCSYLPIPHRSLLVTEETNLGVFVDPITTGAIDAIRMLAGIDTDMSTHSVRTKENRTCRSLEGLRVFFEETYKETMAAKEGVFRKHVFATRSHFSFRAVVSSITNRHNYDEIYIPWGVATSVFRLHLLNKLLKLGYSPNEGINLINSCARTYDPLLDRLFQEIISESPSGRGVNATLNRNPSLARGSIQSVYISKVKTDVDDPTVSMSILVVRALNADFDGGALNFTLSIDKVIEDRLKFLDPHMSAFSLENPREISDSLTMPKPVVSTIASWLDAPIDPPDPVKLQKMQAFLA